MEVVLVEHEYEYTTKNGRLVSIKPNESYLLIAKTNDHWWHVRKDMDSKPFYVPAQYMKKTTSGKENSEETSAQDSQTSQTITLKEKTDLNSFGQKYRFSTFGLRVPDDDPLEQNPKNINSSFAQNSKDNTSDSDCCLYAKPLSKFEGQRQSKNSIKEEVKLQLTTFQIQVETIDDDSFEFPPPPTPTLFLNDEEPKLIPESDTKSGLNIVQNDGNTKKKETESHVETTASTGGPPPKKVRISSASF